MQRSTFSVWTKFFVLVGCDFRFFRFFFQFFTGIAHVLSEGRYRRQQQRRTRSIENYHSDDDDDRHILREQVSIAFFHNKNLIFNNCYEIYFNFHSIIRYVRLCIFFISIFSLFFFLSMCNAVASISIKFKIGS